MRARASACVRERARESGKGEIGHEKDGDIERDIGDREFALVVNDDMHATYPHLIPKEML